MLDAELINRAAPVGSMRYFALLYASPEERLALEALLAFDAEIRASLEAAHEVAHARLQWWRNEIDQLIKRQAQHPATRALQHSLPQTDFSVLHERLVAADLDLACMTYHTTDELAAYFERSGGALFAPLAPQDATLRRAGAFIRRVETLRDVASDVRAGRVYWSLEELKARGIDIGDLSNPHAPDAVRRLIASEIVRLQTEYATLHTPSRSLNVLMALHQRLLHRIARANFDVFIQRHELKPFEKVWTAWRAARNSERLSVRG